jgi:hypothetical protein
MTMSSAVSARPSETRIEKDPIRYACERCKSERVLVTPRSLGPRAWVSAHLQVVARSLRLGDGAPATFAQIRAEKLLRAEDDAFRSFTSHFRFCHECRRFVCPGCWSRSREKCKSCLVREAKQAGQEHGRLRSNLGVTAAGVAFLLALSFGSVLAAYNLPPVGPARPIQGTPTASELGALVSHWAQTHGGAGSNGASTTLPNGSSSPSESGSQTQPGSPAASGPAASGPEASETASTASGAATPIATPSYETDPSVKIHCSPTSGAAPLTVSCTIQGEGYTDFIWLLDGAPAAAPPYVLSAGSHTVQGKILRGGKWRLSNLVVIAVS